MKDKAAATGDDKKKCTDLLTKYDKTKKEWQLGKTKVRLQQFSDALPLLDRRNL